jgi:hypothetical protein
MSDPKEVRRAVVAGSEIAKTNAAIGYLKRVKALFSSQALPVVEQIETAALEATNIIDAAEAQIKAIDIRETSDN